MFRFLICSFSLVLLYPTAIDLYLVGLPQIATDLSVSDAELHLAFSVYLAGMASTMIFAGKASDTIGRKPVALVGAVIFTLASLLGGSTLDYHWFISARLLQGVGAGSCYVVAFAILRDVLDEHHRAKVLSMINGITCIVPVLAPVIGHLIMLQYPWSTLFSVMAAMGVVVGILTLFVLKETKPTHTLSHDHLQRDKGQLESFIQPKFLVYLVITSLGMTSILTFVNVSPMLIMTKMGFDRGGYSSIMAATALVSMVTSFSAPFLLNRCKPRVLLCTAKVIYAFAAVSLLVTYHAELDNTGYLLGFACICAAFSLGFGVSMSGALAPFSARAGVASSVLGVTQVCVSALYIWGMGALGISALMMLVVSVSLTSVISLLLILWLAQKENVTTDEQTTQQA
ncbi:MFS transporter [Vibrio sp. FNV 38]|nr:MFS transporter [Vibrio sp. FNV 38]